MDAKQERKKSSITTPKRSRLSIKKSIGSRSSASVTIGTVYEDDSLQDEVKISQQINYQDELVFIFFNSMLETVIEEWNCIVEESKEPSLAEDQSVGDVVTKDYRELGSEDLSNSHVISVNGSQVSLAKKKKRRRSSDRSKNSKHESLNGEKTKSKSKRDSRSSGGSKSQRNSLRRKSSERKRSKKLRQMSTSQTGTDLDENKSLMSQIKDLAEESSHSLDWILTSEQEYVRINFKNGNVYQGPVFRKVMHGIGTFYWADGSVYEGEFQNGFISGKGFLSLPDLSYYKGEFCRGMFHGEGVLFIMRTKIIYSGQWKGGRKHGKGWLLYEPGNWYNGDWFEDKRHGIGLRRYKSGAIYKGEWCCGLKNHQGTMRWENNDFYKGEWSNGLMHGYGEYTWNAFLTETLTFPSENIYSGSWNNGTRDGIGLMRFGTEGGSKMAGVWESNLKHGAGVLVCGNGQQIELNPLFLCDKPITQNHDDSFNGNNTGSKSSIQMIAKKVNSKRPNKKLDKKTIDNITKRKFKGGGGAKKRRVSSSNSSFEEMTCNSVHVPIHAVPEQMDLSYVMELCLEKYSKLLQNMPSGSIVFDKSLKNNSSDRTVETSKWNILTNPSCEQSFIRIGNQKSSTVFSTDIGRNEFAMVVQSQIEEKNLRNTFVVYLPKLYKLFNQYATLASSEPVNFKPLIPRLFLWQLWIDIGIREKGLSIIDTDLILADNNTNGLETEHDPFEKLCFWQFLQALLSMTWFYYENEDIEPYVKDGILASLFKKFLEEVVTPNIGKYIGHSLFEFKNLIPINSTYLLYCSLGEPHSARKFLNSTCIKKGDSPPCYLTIPEKETKKYCEGTNMVPVGSNVMFIPVDPPEVGRSPKSPREEVEHSDLYYKTLMTFRELRAKKVVQCLAMICPNIKQEGVIVNMDYQLSFLEFYETILLCAFAVANKVRMREERIRYQEELDKMRKLEEEAALAANADKLSKKGAKGKVKPK